MPRKSKQSDQRMRRGDAVRARLAARSLTEADIADAVAWARKTTA